MSEMMVVDGGDSPAAAKLELFLSIGLDKRTAENALVNHKVTSNLVAVIKEVYVKHFHHVFSIKLVARELLGITQRSLMPLINLSSIAFEL